MLSNGEVDMATKTGIPPLEEQARMIAEAKEAPSYKPPHMFIRGTMGPYELLVPVWSMSIGLNIMDMFDKAARRLKVAAQIDLWATDGTWTENAWRSLKHTSLSGERLVK